MTFIKHLLIIFIGYYCFSLTPIGSKVIHKIHNNDVSNELYCKTHILAQYLNIADKSMYQKRQLFEKCDDKSIIFN